MAGSTFSDLPWLPSLNDAKFWERLAKSGLYSAGVTASSVLLGEALQHALERKKRMKDLREVVSASSPVLSLDPHLDDLTKEVALARAGVTDTQGEEAPVPVVGEEPPGEVLPQEAPLAEAPKPAEFPGESEVVHVSEGEGASTTGTPFHSRLEPGILLATAYLGGLIGFHVGSRESGKIVVNAEKEKMKRLQNELEKAEFNRLYQMHDPEGFEAAQAEEQQKARSMTHAIKNLFRGGRHVRRTAEAAKVLAEHSSASTTGMEKGIFRLLKDGFVSSAKSGWDALASVAGNAFQKTQDTADTVEHKVGEAVHKGVEAGKTAGNYALNTGAVLYPPYFMAALLGSGLLAKHFFDSHDPERFKRKLIKKALKNNLLSQQNPVIIEVGSELPWEKAKHGGADKALDPAEELPEEAEKAAEREAREIRL